MDWVLQKERMKNPRTSFRQFGDFAPKLVDDSTREYEVSAEPSSMQRLDGYFTPATAFLDDHSVPHVDAYMTTPRRIIDGLEEKQVPFSNIEGYWSAD